MKMQTRRTKAIVLRRTNYGEADRILQLLTPEGKTSVMARGARKEKSRLAGGIELFAVSDIVIGKGKGELGVLTSARMITFFNHILEDYNKMQFAYEIIKQVSKASDQLDEPDWYDLLEEALGALNDQTIQLCLVQVWFYLRYSKLLGYELSFVHDVNGNGLKPDAFYSYDINEKGLRQNLNGNINSDHIKLMRLVGLKKISVVSQIGGIDSILSVCCDTARKHVSLY